MKVIVTVAAIAAASGAAFGQAFAENFDSGIPGGWTVIDNEGSGVVWTNIAGSGESGNFTNGSGDAASVSSDVFGTAEFDTELISPSFTVPSGASLTYTTNYQNFAFLDFADVDINTGSGWVNLLSWNEDHGTFRGTPGEDVVLDLSAYGGQTASIRFHYYDPNTGDFDWYWQVDNVAVTPAPGALALLGLGGLAATRRRR